ncbi:MAG: hypothetical protein WBQ69_02495 [Gallionella sp.]
MAPSYFKRMVTPGSIPQNIAVNGSYIAILLVFALGVISGSEITLQILYVFPLFIISVHCGRKDLVIGAVVLSVMLEAITLLTYKISTNSKLIEMLMGLCSNVLVAFVGYYARSVLLEHAQHSRSTKR